MSILKLGPQKYRIQIDVGRDINGKRKRHWTTVNGTRREAERVERDEKTRVSGGIYVKPDRITVAEWFDRWLPRHHAAGNVAPQSRDRYEGIIRVHVVPHVGALKLQDLRSDHIADLRARWLVEDGLSPSTVHKHLHILRRALEDAVTDGLLVRNPAERVKSPPQKQNREQRALTRAEIRLLIGAAEGTWFEMPVRFSLATGVRRGELLALEWDDVDLQQRTVRVRGTKTRHANRTLRISEQTATQLRNHATAQKIERLRLGPIWEDHHLVFPASNGKPKLPNVFSRDRRDLVRRSGINDPQTARWHTLRHTAASMWISSGLDVYSVSRRLGHASAAFTLATYAHLMEGQDDAVATALDALLA